MYCLKFLFASTYAIHGLMTSLSTDSIDYIKQLIEITHDYIK